MRTERRSLYAVGKVVKVFGVRGDVVVQPMTSSPERFKKLKTLQVGLSENETQVLTVSEVYVEGRGTRMHFNEIADRTAAEHLVGMLLFVDETQRVRLPRGTFFVHDVVGMEVVDQKDHPVGVVKEVLKMPANDIYVVARTSGSEVMIPAVKQFIRSVDVKARIMRVELIEGMIEE
ncbi:MAG: ribosome maturation factor RimM [Bacteroidota bacterium]